ncbi:MAG: ABC transporter substrate-binding protein [Alphaproteobacteria bacterium]|jgi:peptide/nickel transport system substrate-binding protein|nr:ABC transporter substrate-binding protein [Alphaproteobacteria bacterium]
MRRFSALAATAFCTLCLALVLSPEAVRAQAAGDPGTLILGQTLEPPHLDPTASAAAAIDELLYANVFEGLTRIDRDGRVVPGLAESWTVSPDGLTYTFQLRAGVTFHDGTAFDSADVAFSLDRARGPDSTNAQKAFFEPIAAVGTPAPDRVVVTLSRPDGLFLFHMAQGDAVIVAPESAATNRTRPIGTGPFRFAGWERGDRVELVRHPAYAGPADPALERVVFRFVSDPAAQSAAMLAGDLDAFPNILAPEALPLFAEDPRLDVVVGTTEGETIMAVNHRRPPFDDVRVRRALMHAIDREGVVAGAMFGYGTPIGSHFAPHHPAYVDLTGRYPYDPARAQALLVEAGYADGFSATLTLPPPAYARRGGEIIQAMLAPLGIRLELEPVEWAQWLETTFRGFDYDMTIIAHTEPLDIGIYARGTDYYFGYVSPAFDTVMAELQTTLDPAARNALFAEAQRILAEDAAAIFLFQLAKHGVHHADLVGLWENSPIQANDVTGVRWETGQ